MYMAEIMPFDEEKPKQDILTIYDNYIYLPFFLSNRVISALLFAWGLKSAIQVGHPMFYKPAKWLSDRV